jgi:hypothetical protein
VLLGLFSEKRMEISAFFQDHRWIFDGKDAEVDSPEKTAVEVARRTSVAIYGEEKGVVESHVEEKA